MQVPSKQVPVAERKGPWLSSSRSRYKPTGGQPGREESPWAFASPGLVATSAQGAPRAWSMGQLKSRRALGGRRARCSPFFDRQFATGFVPLGSRVKSPSQLQPTNRNNLDSTIFIERRIILRASQHFTFNSFLPNSTASEELCSCYLVLVSGWILHDAGFIAPR